MLHLDRQGLAQGFAVKLFHTNIGLPGTSRLALILALGNFVSGLDDRTAEEATVGLRKEMFSAIRIWRDWKILFRMFFLWNRVLVRELASRSEVEVAEGRREGGGQ